VRHNPDPVPAVRGIDTASWNNTRLAGVADAFQVRKHSVEFHAVVETNEAVNVFKYEPSWFENCSSCKSFRPEPAVIS
jgi:hypothetical protein